MLRSRAARALRHASSSAFPLEERCVLRVAGADAVSHLQTLTTNDVRSLGEPGATVPLYTALLSSAGRVLFDAFLHPEARTGAEAPAVLLECERASGAALRSHLLRFRLRSRVEVEDVSGDWRVWVALPPQSDEGGSAGPRDPRLPALGWRQLRPAAAAAAGEPHAAGAAQAYRRHRMLLGVAEGAGELAGELPLECNMDGLSAVSFTKGCYLGQELTSRTHFRGVIRKRVLPFSLPEGGPGAAVGDSLGKGGRVLAFDCGKEGGGVGVALVRLETLGEDGTALLLVGEAGGVMAHVRKPDWWPEQWMASIKQ